MASLAPRERPGAVEDDGRAPRPVGARGGRPIRAPRAGRRAPGGTAFAAARARAVHLALDSAPCLVEDRHAARYFGAALAADLARADSPDCTEGGRSMRTALVVRQRFAEDAVREAFGRATRQFVNLACGLDFFADRRDAAMHEMRVFELDAARMLRDKQRIRRSLGLAPPANTVACAVDLRREDWWRALVRRGFQPQSPAVFAWLGCTQYLTPEAVGSTLRVIGSRSPPGTQLVFDYKLPLTLLPDVERGLIEQAMRRAAKRGEPWLSFFAPGELSALLLQHGFGGVELFDAAQLQARYLAGRADGLVFPNFMQLGIARAGAAGCVVR